MHTSTQGAAAQVRMYSPAAAPETYCYHASHNTALLLLAVLVPASCSRLGKKACSTWLRSCADTPHTTPCCSAASAASLLLPHTQLSHCPSAILLLPHPVPLLPLCFSRCPAASACEAAPAQPSCPSVLPVMQPVLDEWLLSAAWGALRGGS